MIRRALLPVASAAVLLAGVAAWRMAAGGKVEAVPGETAGLTAPSLKSVAKKPGRSRAASEPATYAAVRLRELKENPALLSDHWAWQKEFAAAKTPALRREVLALAREVGPEALLAVIVPAVKDPDALVQLEAARSIFLLPEERLRDGVAAALAGADGSTAGEIVEGIGQLNPELQPPLIAAAIQAGSLEAQARAVSLALDRPSPAMFEALIQGLRSSDPRAQSLFDGAIVQMVDQHFRTYEEAQRWWTANRENFDGMMLRSR